MGGCDGEADGEGRRHHVASADFVAHRVDDQHQNKGNESFDDKSLAWLKDCVQIGLSQTFVKPIRRDELTNKTRFEQTIRKPACAYHYVYFNSAAHDTAKFKFKFKFDDNNYLCSQYDLTGENVNV